MKRRDKEKLKKIEEREWKRLLKELKQNGLNIKEITPSEKEMWMMGFWKGFVWGNLNG
jgi:hypothetical protein